MAPRANDQCACGATLFWEVLHTSGGWAVATTCHEPSCVNVNKLIERASHYYESQKEAQLALNNGTVRWLMGHGQLANVNKSFR